MNNNLCRLAVVALVVITAGCGGSNFGTGLVPPVQNGITQPNSITQNATTNPTASPNPSGTDVQGAIRTPESTAAGYLTGTFPNLPAAAQPNVAVVLPNGTSQPLTRGTTLRLTGTVTIVAVNSILNGVVYVPNPARQVKTVYANSATQVAISYAIDQTATQGWRVNAILNRAYQDNGQTFWGVECKPWVSRVVLAATGITAPPTTDNGYGWKWTYSPYFDVVPGGISAVRRGDIVQMNITQGSPHTFIVVNVYANQTMDVIESNYTAKYEVMTRPNSVKPTPITFASIQKYYAHTVYRINGKP